MRRTAFGMTIAAVATAATILLGTSGAVAAPGETASAHMPTDCTIIPNPTLHDHTVCPDTDLSGMSFSYTDLSYAVLYGANLHGDALNGATLAGAHLKGADLHGVSSGGIIGVPAAIPRNWGVLDGYLTGPYANLSYADFEDTDLTLGGGDFADANLHGADLAYVDNPGIRDVTLDFSHAVLTRADFADGYFLASNLTGANLAGDNLDGFFQGSNFTDADLRDIEISGVTTGYPLGFPDSGLSGADLEGANISGADLEEDVFSDANLSDGNFSHTYLSGSLMTDANLTDANLKDANLDQVDMTGANLDDAHMAGATLKLVVWDDTTCPDGTNSNNDGDTCAKHLKPGSS
jgi:uncharacterized protein YjbI with pentapeptide repeats